MGMYTEIVISTRIKNIPEVVEVLKYMAGITETQPKLPDHPLFKTPRWTCLFKMSSYYFTPRATVLFEWDDIGGYWCLISRSDLKNYDQEIEQFFDWIKSFVDHAYGEMIGYSRYEETREPTIWYGSLEPQS